MPFIQDYSEDEDQAPSGGGGGRLRGGGVSGSVGAAPSKQVEPDFVPWDRFVSANQEVSQREAGKLAGNVETQAQDVSSRRTTAAEKQSEAVNQNYAGYQPQTKPQAVSSFGKPAASFGEAGATQAQAPAGATADDGGDWSAFIRPPEPPPKQSSQPKQSATAPDGAAQGADAFDAGPQGGMTVGAAMPTPSLGETRRESPVRSDAMASKFWDATKQLDKDKLWYNPATGKSEGFELSGWKSLEDQLGKAGWEQLVGDTLRAEEAATALGSEGGVEALLDQQYGNATGFDAALVGGAGGDRFRDLAEQYGSGALTGALGDAAGAARSGWERLMDDVSSAGATRDADIDAYAAEQRRLADEGALEDAEAATLQQKAADARAYLEQNFPVAPQFQTQDGMLDWMEDNRNGPGGANSQQGGYSNLMAWSQQIYGEASQANIDQLYADIRRMTPEEYEAFKYGIVPPWMGLGAAASVLNGGGFGGLGFTGTRTTAVGTNNAAPGTTVNALGQEMSWDEWQAALNTLNQVMAAIAAGG